MTSNVIHFIQSPETPFRKKARELAEKYPTLEEAKVRMKTFAENPWKKTNQNEGNIEIFFIVFKLIFCELCFFCVGKMCINLFPLLVSSSIASSWAPKFGTTTWFWQRPGRRICCFCKRRRKMLPSGKGPWKMGNQADKAKPEEEVAIGYTDTPP